jgi:hypothetical protein
VIFARTLPPTTGRPNADYVSVVQTGADGSLSRRQASPRLAEATMPITLPRLHPALMIVIGLAAWWRDYWRHTAGSQEP